MCMHYQMCDQSAFILPIYLMLILYLGSSIIDFYLVYINWMTLPLETMIQVGDSDSIMLNLEAFHDQTQKGSLCINNDIKTLIIWL